MAEIKTIQIKVDAESAKISLEKLAKTAEDLKYLNETIEEQRQILIELERELIKVEEQQQKTSKANLAAQKALSAQSEHLKSSIKDQRLSLRELNSEKRTASSVNKEATIQQKQLTAATFQQSKIFKLLDMATGGYATKSVKVYKGVKETGKAFIQLKNSSKIALQGIKTGIAATGIGLLLLAVGAVAAYWDDIKAAVSGVSDEQKHLNVLADEQVKIEQDKLNSIGDQDNILKLQGKSEKDILKLKAAQTDEVISATKEQINQTIITSKAQTEAAERNHKLTKGILAMMQAPVMLLLGAVDALTYGLEQVGLMDKGTSLANDLLDWEASFFFDPAETKAEGEALLAEQKASLAKLENDRAGHQLRMNAIEVEGNRKSSANRKKTNNNKKQEAADNRNLEAEADEKAKNLQLERERKFEEKIEKIDEENFQNRLKASMSKEAYELELVRQKYWALEEAAKDNAEQLAIITTAKENELKAITDKYKEEKKEADEVTKAQEIEDAEAATERFINFSADSAKEMMSIIGELAQQSQDKFKDLNSKILDNEELTDKQKTKLLNENNKRAKKAFDTQKAAAIASTLITTYMSARSAYQSQFTPLPDPSSPVRGAIAAGLAVAGGLLSVKNIASQKFEGASVGSASDPSGGGVGDGGGGGNQQQAPQFNVVGNSGINQLAQLQQQPTQAYVVSGAVTSCAIA